jgi:two-component system CheB/CheR fusion protein
VALDELIRATLEPYLGKQGDDIAIAGPAVAIDPKASSILGMVLYELASNAMKYGALRPDPKQGRLTVGWSVETRDGRRWLSLSWKETLGEPLRATEARGFGTTFIERSLSYELSGSASLAFESDGLSCVLAFPLEPGAV